MRTSCHVSGQSTVLKLLFQSTVHTVKLLFIRFVYAVHSYNLYVLLIHTYATVLVDQVLQTECPVPVADLHCAGYKDCARYPTSLPVQ